MKSQQNPVRRLDRIEERLKQLEDDLDAVVDEVEENPLQEEDEEADHRKRRRNRR